MDIGQAFRDAVTGIFPAAVFSSISAKHLSQNTRISLSPEGNASGSAKRLVLKLEKVLVASMPKSKFTPVWITTRDKSLSIIGVRLTPHGGEVAVELARKLARKATLQLVVLGTNVISMSLVDASKPSFRPSTSFTSIPENDPGARSNVTALLEKFKRISDEFHARIDAMVS